MNEVTYKNTKCIDCGYSYSVAYKDGRIVDDPGCPQCRKKDELCLMLEGAKEMVFSANEEQLDELEKRIVEFVEGIPV